MFLIKLRTFLKRTVSDIVCFEVRMATHIHSEPFASYMFIYSVLHNKPVGLFVGTVDTISEFALIEIVQLLSIFIFCNIMAVLEHRNGAVPITIIASIFAK